MTVYCDMLDWLGGYPFEVASPEVIFHFFRERGFDLTELKTVNTLANNQFVFRRRDEGSLAAE